MKVRQKFDPPPTLEATMFVWPDIKPVKKGDMFLDMPVFLNDYGAYVQLPSLSGVHSDRPEYRVRNGDWVVANPPGEHPWMERYTKYTEEKFLATFEFVE